MDDGSVSPKAETIEHRLLASLLLQDEAVKLTTDAWPRRRPSDHL